jgi:hypothetical protein
MRIELFSHAPDGGPNWIDVREAIKGGDIFAVREAAVVPLDDEGRATSMSFQAMDDAQFIALFHRVVTGWSFQTPLPIPSVADARSLLSDLEADDLKKVRADMKPLLDKVKDDTLPGDPKSGHLPADAVDGGPAPEAEG